MQERVGSRLLVSVETITPIVEGDEDLGPAMRALTDRQRRFVRMYLDYPTARDYVLAKMAGYSANSAVAIRVAAHRLLHTPGVLAAINEEIDKRFKGKGVAISQRALFRIASTDGHKDQIKAAVALLDRGGFQVTSEHRVTVEKTDRTGKAMVGRIRALAERLGIDAEKLLGANAEPKLIEGEAREVTS